ncbi:MAG: hypothetical protein ABSD03_11085 [Vulcanimicrobiaceae bacterium]|jgi:hypothetical protein
MDWNRERIDAVAAAVARVQRGIVPAEKCANCRRPSIEVDYSGRCPFCALADLHARGTPEQKERWLLTGLVA